MRRQLVPGPVVRLTVIKAKTRPGIEAMVLLEQMTDGGGDQVPALVPSLIQVIGVVPLMVYPVSQV